MLRSIISRVPRPAYTRRVPLRSLFIRGRVVSRAVQGSHRHYAAKGAGLAGLLGVGGIAACQGNDNGKSADKSGNASATADRAENTEKAEQAEIANRSWFGALLGFPAQEKVGKAVRGASSAVVAAPKQAADAVKFVGAKVADTTAQGARATLGLATSAVTGVHSAAAALSEKSIEKGTELMLAAGSIMTQEMRAANVSGSAAVGVSMVFISLHTAINVDKDGDKADKAKSDEQPKPKIDMVVKGTALPAGSLPEETIQKTWQDFTPIDPVLRAGVRKVIQGVHVSAKTLQSNGYKGRVSSTVTIKVLGAGVSLTMSADVNEAAECSPAEAPDGLDGAVSVQPPASAADSDGPSSVDDHESSRPDDWED